METVNISRNVYIANIFTPNGDAANATTFETDGDITTAGDIIIPQVFAISGTSDKLLFKDNSPNTSFGNAGINFIGGAQFNEANGSRLSFFTNDTASLNIIKNGNVGINDTTPSEKLEVGGNIRCDHKLFGDGATLEMMTNTDIGDSIGWITLRVNETVIGGPTIKFYSGSTTNSPGTQRMTILSNGNVGIGTSSPDFPLDIATSATGLDTTVRTFMNASNTTISRSSNWSNDTISIRSDASIVAGGYIGVSDVRIKKDIMDLSSTLPLIEQIKPRTYKFINPKLIEI